MNLRSNGIWGIFMRPQEYYINKVVPSNWSSNCKVWGFTSNKELQVLEILKRVRCILKGGKFLFQNELFTDAPDWKACRTLHITYMRGTTARKAASGIHALSSGMRAMCRNLMELQGHYGFNDNRTSPSMR